MRTSKSQLRWLWMWTIRILFFPVWIWVAKRRSDRELSKVETSVYTHPCSKCGKHFGYADLLDGRGRWVGWCITCDEVGSPAPDAITKDAGIDWKTHIPPSWKAKQCAEVEYKESFWQLQILDKRKCILGQEDGRLVDEEEGLVVYADFNLQEPTTIHGSRVLHRGKILSAADLPCGPLMVTPHDTVVMRHALSLAPEPEPEPERIKNKHLRRIQLMTANSRVCKNGSFPVNEYALIDNGDMESLGKQVKVKFVEWYPKATWIKADGTIRTSYDTDSVLFKDIQKKFETRISHNARYGPEFVLELESGELVTFYCGNRSARRVSMDFIKSPGAPHYLETRVLAMGSKEWMTLKVTLIRPKADTLWMGKPISGLGDKHLWNIIQAVENGHWASGQAVRFNPVTATALLDEYAKRKDAGHYSKKKVKKIKKANKKYEESMNH